MNSRKIQLPYKSGTGLPYTLAFCFPKSGPVVVAGPCKDVEKYVIEKINPCHYHVVHFKYGETRSYWRFNVTHLTIYDKGMDKFVNGKKKRYCFTIHNSRTRTRKYIRRLPLRYMKEELG